MWILNLDLHRDVGCAEEMSHFSDANVLKVLNVGGNTLSSIAWTTNFQHGSVAPVGWSIRGIHANNVSQTSQSQIQFHLKLVPSSGIDIQLGIHIHGWLNVA